MLWNHSPVEDAVLFRTISNPLLFIGESHNGMFAESKADCRERRRLRLSNHTQVDAKHSFALPNDTDDENIHKMERSNEIDDGP